MEKKRIIYLDVLRITATFSVIVLHVSASLFSGFSPDSYEWQILNIYDSLVRFCVPMLVMISGVLFLSPYREISVKILYQKYIKRIVCASVFWSALYAIYSSSIYRVFSSERMMFFFRNFVLGHYHLWFLYMILGLYIIVPFLKKITADKKLTEYFLLWSMILTIIVPSALLLPFLGTHVISQILDKLYIKFFLGYSVFFVAGHYISQYPIKKLLG